MVPLTLLQSSSPDSIGHGYFTNVDRDDGYVDFFSDHSAESFYHDDDRYGYGFGVDKYMGYD
jgi:hypothetical protein